MRFDMSQALSQGFLLPPATYDADNTPAAFDIGKADACTLMIAIGVGGVTFSGTKKIEFVLTHSDDDSTYTNVTAADVVGVDSVEDGIIKALTAAHDTPTVSSFGYVGGKRYLKLLADFSGTHGTGTPIAGVAIRGRLERVAPPA